MADASNNLSKPFDEVEKRIVAILEAIPNDAKENGWEWNRSSWTKRIKSDLVKLAHEFGYLAACSGVAKESDHQPVQGEWLYDMIWWKQDGKYLSKIILVFESEWTPNLPMDDDFFKLMVARADHHVWVFQEKTEETVRKAIGTCIDHLRHFHGLSSGDRFLFAGVSWNPRKFHFDLYVYP